MTSAADSLGPQPVIAGALKDEHVVVADQLGMQNVIAAPGLACLSGADVPIADMRRVQQCIVQVS